jgi:SNF2 family DNA or RNA helicase
MVYKLVTLGTVEEELNRLQERKKAISDAILRDNGDPVGSLTWEEIKELFEITG